MSENGPVVVEILQFQVFPSLLKALPVTGNKPGMSRMEEGIV